MTQSTAISDAAWTEIGTGLTVCVVQPSGDCEVFLGASAPALTDVGFFIESGSPVELPQVAALGGGVWVRSSEDAGNVTHASA